MTTTLSRLALPLLLVAASLPSQSTPNAGPEALAKGPPGSSARSPEQWQDIRFGRRPQAEPAGSVAAAARDTMSRWLPDRVIVDDRGDGSLMAVGATYKAMLGPDGFTYVPFFGSQAPRNYPVHFEVRSVTVGDEPLAFADSATVSRRDSRITLDRGAVREVLDLGLEQVEQTLVIDATVPGDVIVELAVTTELQEDAGRPGLQFGNELGRVDYGTAFVVQGGMKTAIDAEWTGTSIVLRVPAALRGDGPVVIDPILGTFAFMLTNSRDSRQPDIAYDVSSGRYMLVWEYAFSANDHDIECEFHDGNGAPIAGTLNLIDASLADERSPRVANVNLVDRFVVVYERTDPARFQGRTMIFSRFQDAMAASPTGSPLQLSDPSFLGNNWAPDVGGDSGTGPTWCVAWMLQVSASESWILERTFNYDGSGTSAFTTIVRQSTNHLNADVSLSQTNGRGFTPSFGWCLVYSHEFSPTDWDIYGVQVNSDGSLGAHAPIDTAGASDRFPSVSSPATDIPGAPLNMVTYERQSPPQARAALVNDTMATFGMLDLTGAFGLGPYWLRCDSDGCRFAVVSGAVTITVATLGFQGSSFVLHEAPQPLSGTPSYPRLCSKRSGGGPNTAYALAWVDESTTPDVIRVTAYSGRQPGATVQRRIMACSTFQIDAAGLSFLGQSLTFSLRNTGNDVVGMLFGPAGLTSTAVCSSCPVGVSLTAPLASYPTANLSLPIPCNAGLVGLTLSMQGYAIGSGPCIAALRFTDTIDFTIR